jgi:hypothetical protein
VTDQPTQSGEQGAAGPSQTGPRVNGVTRAAISDSSIARLDNSLAFVGAVATGIGVFAASQPGLGAPALMLRTIATICAAFAFVCALIAQLFAVPFLRDLRHPGAASVKPDYTLIARRAFYTRISIFLLLAATLLALITFGLAFVNYPPSSVITITQVLEQGNNPAGVATPQSSILTKLTVAVSVPNLPSGSGVVVEVTHGNQILAESVATISPNGTASTSLTISHVPEDERITISVDSPLASCHTTISLIQRKSYLSCRSP